MEGNGGNYTLMSYECHSGSFNQVILPTNNDCYEIDYEEHSIALIYQYILIIKLVNF